MSSATGKALKLSIFGQSHGEGIGVVIDGLPPGEVIDIDVLNAFLARRAPGKSALSTQRREVDSVDILSGLLNKKTCGAPLCAVIKNTDTRSNDYAGFMNTPRPGHADFTAVRRFGADCDLRGGGHFSGRLTAPLCIAGGICAQLLQRRGITIGAHIASIYDVCDDAFDPVLTTPETLMELAKKPLAVLNGAAGERMSAAILQARENGDSVGGVVECCAVGMPSGVGTPMFDGVENRIASAVFAIPAVKGVEFGAGFEASRKKGSDNNDSFVMHGGRVATKTNNCGGILGGITTGMPILFRAAFKPTPSISSAQRTVELNTGESVELSITGRHDPCIVPRAVVCVEAAAAFALTDMLMSERRELL